jgi:hypothetical protein
VAVDQPPTSEQKPQHVPDSWAGARSARRTTVFPNGHNAKILIRSAATPKGVVMMRMYMSAASFMPTDDLAKLSLRPCRARVVPLAA